MTKIWTIARKDLILRFTDRNLLLLLLAAPLAISTIVGLVFGGLGAGGSGLNIADIPVAIFNQDAGAVQQGENVNYGASLVRFLIPSDGASNPLAAAGTCTLVANETDTDGSGFDFTIDELITAEQINDVAVGRTGVENGDYAVLIVIPSGFSQGLSPQIGPSAGGGEPVEIEVYANSGETLAGTVVRSVVEGFTNRLLTGNIAISASINSLIVQDAVAAGRLNTGQDALDLGGIFACGFSDTLATVNLDPQPIIVGDDTEDERSIATLILVQVGSAQAVLFALFAAQFGVLSIIEERRAGTLQRMLSTPTPRTAIIAGKLLGTVVTAIFQLVLLMVALTLIASLLEGGLILIWGSNVLALALMVLTLALAVSGLGVLLTGIARTPEQVGPIGAILNIVMGVLGGAFGFSVGAPLAYLSLIYWGTDAFQKLAAGNNDILLNGVVLLAQGVLLFAVGLFLFNRRVEV